MYHMPAGQPEAHGSPGRSSLSARCREGSRRRSADELPCAADGQWRVAARRSGPAAFQGQVWGGRGGCEAELRRGL